MAARDAELQDPLVDDDSDESYSVRGDETARFRTRDSSSQARALRPGEGAIEVREDSLPRSSEL